MRILEIVSSIDFSSGGPSKSISEMGYQLAKNSIEISLITGVSPNPYLCTSPNGNLKLDFVNFSLMKKAIYNAIYTQKFDILHGHGLWQSPVHYMAKIAQKLELHYIISPRGMLEPWALNYGKWKKKFALNLYQRKDLENADCIHATSESEALNIRKIGFNNPIAVIPNGIDLNEFSGVHYQKNCKKHKILFISRIHPKKGIEFLINAWSKIESSIRKDWEIEIIGNGTKKYITSLMQLIKDKRLENQITIKDPIYGNEKIKAYQKADIFVLPTFSENFGIVVAEALACGLPVITTKGTPWEELSIYKAGWWIDVGSDPLTVALEEAIRLTDDERMAMGLSGRKLIEENYSIELAAKKMFKLYEWLINKNQKPDFVI